MAALTAFNREKRALTALNRKNTGVNALMALFCRYKGINGI